MIIPPLLPVSLLSLPVRGAWIEIYFPVLWKHWSLSLPVRGAWIEIAIQIHDKKTCPVAPCEGSVD